MSTQVAAAPMVLDPPSLTSLIRGYVTGRRGPLPAGGLMAHPLMQQLESTGIGPDRLLIYCDFRYNGAYKFEELLEHTYRLARANPSTQQLANALYRNLCDERGLEYDSGMPHGEGSHHAWRENFLTALGLKPDAQKKDMLYAHGPEDSLALLTGVLIAAEFVIPLEKFRVLHALRTLFSERFTPAHTHAPATEAQRKATHYLQDHIEHDLNRHLPELIDAAVADLTTAQQQNELLQGVARFLQERQDFYTTMHQQVVR